MTLIGLRNVGPAARKDLEILGIRTREELAACDADTLYEKLCLVTGVRHDPCVHDVFSAAIHQSKTGEALDWWRFTPSRKLREQNGSFVAVSTRIRKI